MLAQVAAMELGSRRIRVNAIGPGLVRTGLTEATWLMPAIVEEFAENAPLGAGITADDVASLVTFLASDEAAWITGELHLIDGGRARSATRTCSARRGEAREGAYESSNWASRASTAPRTPFSRML
jgi:NAD(P)-dependent dehydrogenase (short-subunit alcohol dehydrogenase family)